MNKFIRFYKQKKLSNEDTSQELPKMAIFENQYYVNVGNKKASITSIKAIRIVRVIVLSWEKDISMANFETENVM
jgi:hypothetical protein